MKLKFRFKLNFGITHKESLFFKMTSKNRQNFINPYFLDHIGEEMMQQIKIQKRRRGRPRKHHCIRHIHILLDEHIARELDKFCEEHLTTKQDLICNMIIQFLYNQSKLNNLLLKKTMKTQRNRYQEFVTLVLHSTLLTITEQYEKVLRNPLLRFRREVLLQLLDRVGLIPHSGTLKRYVLKMQAEELIINRLPGGIVVVASPDQFKEYLNSTAFQPELQQNWEKLVNWYEQLSQRLSRRLP